MANRNFSDVQALARKQIVLAGSVSLSALAAVSSQDFLGGTIAKTGTGEYTLTLADQYQKLLSASLQVAESAGGTVGVVGAADVVTAKTVKLLTVTAGAPADVTATAKLYITLVLSNSSVN